MVNYIEKSGSSISEAIIILQAQDEQEGVQAEYIYLSEKIGKKNVDWELISQSLLSHNGRFYDKLNIKLPNGSEKDFYFDISDFFGKY